VDTNKLEGVWFHSHEEDHNDCVVYRRDSYDFPRSRAPRASLTFKPDGNAAIGRPGPADAADYSFGGWDLADSILTLSVSGRHTVFEIISVDEEMLVLRRLVTEEATNGEE
jgi:hypothetical protein